MAGSLPQRQLALLEGRDDKADEAAIFAGIQGTVGYSAVAAGCDA